MMILWPGIVTYNPRIFSKKWMSEADFQDQCAKLIFLVGGLFLLKKGGAWCMTCMARLSS